MTPTFIDSHAHLDLYSDDRNDVLVRARLAGIETILAIGIGDGPATMHRALDLAQELIDRDRADLPRVFATAGIYPGDADAADTQAYGRLRALLESPLVLACGEIGLDYYHLESPAVPVQKAAFVEQMRLAAIAEKPIILHCRTAELATPQARQKFAGHDAWEDLLSLIEEHWQPTGLPGIMHCFSGTPAHAQRAVKLGFYLSFAGNLTYPAAGEIRLAASSAPPERILLETDSPFLAPVPHRGTRNEPCRLCSTAEALAALRGISLMDLSRLTGQNFKRLFPTIIA